MVPAVTIIKSLTSLTGVGETFSTSKRSASDGSGRWSHNRSIAMGTSGREEASIAAPGGTQRLHRRRCSGTGCISVSFGTGPRFGISAQTGKDATLIRSESSEAIPIQPHQALSASYSGLKTFLLPPHLSGTLGMVPLITNSNDMTLRITRRRVWHCRHLQRPEDFRLYKRKYL